MGASDQQKIPENNVGAQLFLTQIVELFASGNTEIIVDYAKTNGEKGKIKVTMEATE